MLTLPLRLYQTSTAGNKWRSEFRLDLPCHDSKVGVAMEEKKEKEEEKNMKEVKEVKVHVETLATALRS